MKMKEMVLFEGEHEVMILFKGDVNIDFQGDFLIRAKDVAAVLEYQGTSATQEVLKFVKADQIIMVRNSNMVNRHNRKIHNTGETFITNLALNRVLGKSEKPKAEPFQDWLYEDVVPAVQKRGVYMTSDAIQKTLEDPDFIINVISEYKKEKEHRLLAEKKIEEMAPKVRYVDTILQSKSSLKTTQIAKDYGLSATDLNKKLHEAGVQYLVNKQWVLYQKHAGKGYTTSSSFHFKHADGTPDVKMNTEWTQRGRLFIHEELTKLGIKANIEKEFDEVR
jgi:anti-repressor protein